MSILEKNTVTDRLVNSIEAFSFPKWASEERASAWKAFKEQGIPSRKHEEYKYTRLDLILKDDFSLNESTSIHKERLSELFIETDAIKVILLNGRYDKDLSDSQNLPKGVIICDIEDAFTNYAELVKNHYSKYADVWSDPFVALNTALTTGGVFVYIDKNVVVERPIQIITISSSDKKGLMNPRGLIIAETHSQATIIESFVTIDSPGKVFNNSLSEVYLGEQSIVKHYKIQDEDVLSNLVNTTQVYQEGKSVFTTNNITLNGGFVRNNLNIVLAGQYIEANLYGLYIPHQTQVVDNHTLADHQQPNCNSNELYKGIAMDQSTATFNGKIYVKKDAQKTNAFQSNKNILLSDDATVNTKPQLEIYADDVKCSHGTSTGKLDEEQLFYLRARGLSEASAKKMLMFAYASEVIEKIELKGLKEYIEGRLMNYFL